MRNWIAFEVALAFLAGPALAVDVRFAERVGNIVDGEIVVETRPGDTLVFDGGVFKMQGRQLLVIAGTIRVDRPTAILSHGLGSEAEARDGTAAAGGRGATGGSWGCRNETVRLNLPGIGSRRLAVRTCNQAGQQGKSGRPGRQGRIGAPGAAIEIQADSVTGSALLLVVGNGQKGGDGQKGGKGGIGGKGLNGQNRAGNALCQNQNSRLDGARGGKGGTGGKGGPGGVGGVGSDIIVSEALRPAVIGMEPSDVFALARTIESGGVLPRPAFPVRVVSVGGLGGDGGARGDRGRGGSGGNAGGNSHCGGGGHAGSPGGQGSTGAVGDTGPFGEPGTIRIR